MQRAIAGLIAIAGVGVAALIFYNVQRTAGTPATTPSAAPAPAVAPPAPPVAPEIRHPVPEVPIDNPLPALDTSDGTMARALAVLAEGRAEQLLSMLVLDGFVRRVVATIDNLPAAKAASRMLPVRRVAGTFTVIGGEDRAAMASANAARYEPYVVLAESIDSQKLAAFYFRHYPLFQQAYRDLGYPKGHFNDRLVAVIDHLLEAPELSAPVALVRPKVLWLYADPALEARSAGQKIVMRMGADHASRIKNRLRAFRAAIVRQ